MPALTRYCHHIARGQAMLERNAAAAQTAADEAAALFPDKAAPHVLRARAALRLGDESLALAEFERGLAANPHSVDAPAAMHDLAQSQLHTAKLRAALSTYRLLAPRSGLLGSRVKRATVLLEAAHVTMAVMALPSTDTTSDESAPQAPATDESNPGAATARGRMGASLDEALAYLLQAARDPHHARRTDVELSLALVLDRSGKLARADALLAEIRGTRAWIAATERRSPAPDDSVQQALLALALERTDPTRAAVQWEKYVAALASGRWSEAAEKRLARLKARRR